MSILAQFVFHQENITIAYMTFTYKFLKIKADYTKDKLPNKREMYPKSATNISIVIRQKKQTKR